MEAPDGGEGPTGSSGPGSTSSRSAPGAPPRRARARRGEGERLRDEILAAAEALLIATGDESALSLRAVAAAVGVSPPAIYLHFADRAELVFAVCERHWLQLEEAMAAAASGVADPVARIRRRGEAYLRFGIEHPEHYRVLMMGRPGDTPERFTDGRLAGSAGIEVVADDLREAIAGGVLPGQDVTEAAVLLWMAVHGMVSLVISKPGFPFPPPDQLYDRLFTMAVRGLGASR